MWPEQPETQELLSQARAGRPEAVERLLTAHREPLRRMIGLRLDAAVAELGEDDREVILMRHGEQLSNQEVAAALGLSEAAASMRYLRAVRRLRAALLPEGGDGQASAGEGRP